MPTFQTEIMREAKTLARLQRAAASQRAALKRTEAAIKHAKRQLRPAGDLVFQGRAQ